MPPDCPAAADSPPLLSLPPPPSPASPFPLPPRPLCPALHHPTQVDVTVNNLLACINTKLLADYCAIEPRLAPLVALVKHWAKQRAVNDPYRGTLSSYCYVLMCIFLLQTRPVPALPALQQLPPTFRRTVGQWTCEFCDEASGGACRGQGAGAAGVQERAVAGAGARAGGGVSAGERERLASVHDRQPAACCCAPWHTTLNPSSPPPPTHPPTPPHPHPPPHPTHPPTHTHTHTAGGVPARLKCRQQREPG